MLLKVPIYVEFETMTPEEVSEIVTKLNTRFTSILSKDKNSFIYGGHQLPSGFIIPKYKIISRNVALKYLRTKK